jgi:biopolymer transport protein ExbD
MTAPAAQTAPLSFLAPDAGAPREGLQVAPLVDIVFLLVGFFMLTSQLIQSQKDPDVQLAAMAAPQAAREAPADVTLNLRADGAVTLDGRRVDPANLDAALASVLARSRARGPVRVVVRADRRQTFDALDRVLEACRRAGLGQVVFRAKEGD